MAGIEVKAPDGNIIAFPEGTSKETMRAAMKKYLAKSAPPPPKGLPDHEEFKARLDNNQARMEAAANGEPMPPLSAPIRKPTPAQPTQLERIGTNFLSGLGSAAETFGRGVDETMGNRPSDQQSTKLFGYEMPDVVSGGANVINGIGRAAGSVLGAGIDLVGVASQPGPMKSSDPLATEMIGENIAKPLMEGAQYVTGSKTPGLDFMKSIGTDPRYAEAAVNVVPGAAGAKKVIGGAIKNIPKPVSKLLKIKDESYSHPSVTSNSLTPQDVASLGNDFDRIQSNTIFSQKLDPDVKNVRVIMDQIVNTGQPVSVANVEKMRKAINDYAYAPTTTAEEARALLMMREATDKMIERVNPQAAANLRNGRAVANRLRLVQELINETQAAKVKGGPLTEAISKSAVLEKELIAEKALREKVGRGFKYTPQMTDKELYRLQSLVQGRTVRNISSVIGKIASAPTLVRGLVLATAGGTGFALGGPAGAAAAMGGLLATGGAAKGVARVGTGRAINALDRAYRQITPEPVPQGPRIQPTITAPNITPVTPRPAAPAGPPPQVAAQPAPLQLAPPAAPGAAATPPGPLPPSRQLPAPGSFTPPPSVIAPPARFKLPTREEMQAVRDELKKLPQAEREAAFSNYLRGLFPENVGGGARTPGAQARLENILAERAKPKSSRKRKK